jgi:hypothetical protein
MNCLSKTLILVFTSMVCACVSAQEWTEASAIQPQRNRQNDHDSPSIRKALCEEIKNEIRTVWRITQRRPTDIAWDETRLVNFTNCECEGANQPRGPANGVRCFVAPIIQVVHHNQKNPSTSSATQKAESSNILDGPMPQQRRIQDTENILSSLDNVAAGPQFASKLKELRDRYRKEIAAPQCEGILQRINKCEAASPNCKPKSDAEVKSCTTLACGQEPAKEIRGQQGCTQWVESDPCSGVSESDKQGRRAGESFLCLGPRGYCASRDPTPEYIAWQKCANKASQCGPDKVCVARCNPKGYISVDSCIADEMHRAPREQDAKHELEIQWNARGTQNKQNFLN